LRNVFTAYATITVIAIVANAASALWNVTRATFIVDNMAEVGVPEPWLPWLAALKTAGAAGLLLGLLGVPYIGTAAAVGLVLYYIGAVAVHFPRRAYRLIPFPAAYLGLAGAALVLTVVR